MSAHPAVPGTKVVARYGDGRLVKGYTFDFRPTAARFHVFSHPGVSSPSVAVAVRDLKALFFVKDHRGNPAYSERKGFPPGDAATGRRVEVVFTDGEVLVGLSEPRPPRASGFMLAPADPESNNLRVYVVVAAVRSVTPLPDPRPSGRPAGPTAPAASRLSLPRRLRAWLGA